MKGIIFTADSVAAILAGRKTQTRGAEMKTEFADFTFNPWRVVNDTRVVASESMWREPLKWNKKAQAEGRRLRVFCASFADVFEDWTGPMSDVRGGEWSTAQAGHWWNYQHETTDDDWMVRDLTMADVRRRLFDLIDRTPNLDYLLLTKRPENIERMLPRHSGFPKDQTMPDPDKFVVEKYWLRPNVWLGVSVENQEQADKRIPELLKIPAAVRFLSVEPMLGPIVLPSEFLALGKRAWTICGGESGPNARPMHPTWVRSLRDQCQAAGVPFHFKQWGAWAERESAGLPDCGFAVHESFWLNADGSRDLLFKKHRSAANVLRTGRVVSGRLLDGRIWDEFPEVRS